MTRLTIWQAKRARIALMPTKLLASPINKSQLSSYGRFNKQVSHFNNSYCGSFYIPTYDIGWG